MTIRVRLIKPSARRFFLAQWNDPITGLIKTRSTKTAVRREADRFAGGLQKELNTGEYGRDGSIPWAKLRARYTIEMSDGRAVRTKLKTQSMWNAVEKHFNPKLLSTVADPNFISRYAAKLRSLELKSQTVRGHLAELRKVLRWAKRMNLIREVPYIDFPRMTSTMRGRPISKDEFDRMIAAVDHCPEIIPPHFAESWKHYLNGLWFSGLRLTESMKLHWTDVSQLMVDLSGRRPMLSIQGAHEKGRRFRMLPITPDFFEFLQLSPNKTGFVFNPLTYPKCRKNGEHRPLAEHCGKVICQIGEVAGVKVNEDKFASAQDLRRAFGYRWSQIVMPKVLQELMRHESIETTMHYYVGRLAEDAADAVWEAASRKRIGSAKLRSRFEILANIAKIIDDLKATDADAAKWVLENLIELGRDEEFHQSKPEPIGGKRGETSLSPEMEIRIERVTGNRSGD